MYWLAPDLQLSRPLHDSQQKLRLRKAKPTSAKDSPWMCNTLLDQAGVEETLTISLLLLQMLHTMSLIHE